LNFETYFNISKCFLLFWKPNVTLFSLCWLADCLSHLLSAQLGVLKGVYCFKGKSAAEVGPTLQASSCWMREAKMPTLCLHIWSLWDN